MVLRFLRGKKVEHVTAGLNKVITQLNQLAEKHDEEMHFHRESANYHSDKTAEMFNEKEKALKIAKNIGSLLEAV